MIEENISKNKNSFYVFSLFTIIFIGILVYSGMFIKAEFGSGARPRPTAGAAAKPPASSEIAGRYVGYTTISTGICSVGAHELVLEIDPDGNVKSTYGMKPDKFLAGRINPEGKIRLSFRDSGTVTTFDGELHAGHIAGRSSVTGDRTCDIPWELWRG